MTAYYSSKEENSWSSEKKMEEDDGLRTIECLRGRLLAERQASRTSKENAELLGNKMVELENKLKEETKKREKAEKRLRFLMKKLESLNVCSTFGGSEQSSSSENSGIFSSSSVSTSGSKDSDEFKYKSQSVSEESSSNQDCSDSSSHKAKSSTQSSPDSKAEHQSSSRVKDCVLEMETNVRTESEDEEYKVDDSMALVPVKVAAGTTKNTIEPKMVKRSVGEVLDALRHAREKIQNSMESRRSMIRVGPV